MNTSRSPRPETAIGRANRSEQPVSRAALPEDLSDRILAGAPEAVLVCDRNGTIRFWNAGAERIFGHLAEEALERILAATSRKKPHPLYASASFGHWNDGLCVQMLHVGPYDDEPVSFNMMQAYCAEHELRRASDSHREIYLSDARKTDPARLKTVLRFGVEPCA